jgi:DNA polymerase IV
LIAYLRIQRFYVRSLGLDEHPDPVVIVKGESVLDINPAGIRRRVESEMSARDAKASLMGGVFREWNSAEYTAAQHAWLDLATEFSDVIEPDEQHTAWIDLTSHPDPLATYRSMLEFIPNCEGGIAENKWLAKLAAGRDPEMSAVFDPTAFLYDLPVGMICQLTPAQSAKLSFLGYGTCGRCLQIPLDVLQKQFGDQAITVWNVVRGYGHEAVHSIYPEKSVADRFYFPNPIEDSTVVEAALLKLSDNLSNRMSSQDLFGSRLRLTIEYEELPVQAVERCFTRPLHDRRSIHFASKRMFDSVASQHPITGIRILIPELEKKKRHQQSFDHLAAREKQSRAETAVRCVRKSYGDGSIILAKDVEVPRRLLVLKEWRDATGWI